MQISVLHLKLICLKKSEVKNRLVIHLICYGFIYLFKKWCDMFLCLLSTLTPMQCIFYDPQRIDALLKRGLFFYENENWNAAIQDFTALLNVDPQNSQARWELFYMRCLKLYYFLQVLSQERKLLKIPDSSLKTVNQFSMLPMNGNLYL